MNDAAANDSFAEGGWVKTMKPDVPQRQTKLRLRILSAAPKTQGDEDSDLDIELNSYENPDIEYLTDYWPLADLYGMVPEFDDQGRACEPALDTQQEILSWALCVLAASPSGRAMIKEAMNEGWCVGLADLQGNDFHLDVPGSLMLLDDNGLLPGALGRSAYFRHMILVALIRALRDVWQEKRHGGFDEDYGPESILMLERVRAADCDVMGILAAWELRSEGYGDLWRHIIGSDQGDMAMVFSTHLERDPSSQFTGNALASAFKQWYQSPARVNACDHETLEYLDEVVQVTRESGSLDNPFGDRVLKPLAVEILSCLPDKTAYLRGRGGDVLSDPLYSGMCDEINQSHLLQIMHDLNVVFVQGVGFSNRSLASKIFPNGEFTPEFEGSRSES